MTKQELIKAITHKFHCFGGGKISEFNPITYALKDYPAQFAAGVEVEEVVNFILNNLPKTTNNDNTP